MIIRHTSCVIKREEMSIFMKIPNTKTANKN